MKKIKIVDYLPTGKENAISSDRLCIITGMKNKRALRQEIARERAEGALIISCYAGGYYLPCKPSEVAEFIKSLEKHNKSTFCSLKSAREYLKTVEGQIELNLSGKE